MSHASQTGIMLAPLQCLHLQAVTQYGHGSRVTIRLTNQALADYRCWIWIDASKKRCCVPGDIYWWSLECGGSYSAHQRLRITSSNLSLKSPAVASTASAQTCPLALRQHDSGGAHQQVGGTHSPALTTQELELWAVALEAGVSLTAQHIPGIQNGVADTASRQIKSRTEWTLDKGIFQSVC